MKPLVGLSLMQEPEFAQAALPLFEKGAVEIVEWSFDMLWGGHRCPAWLDGLLDDFSQAGRLLGHGVTYSLFSADAEARAQEWCEQIRDEVALRRYRHISEHFGFMAGGDFHHGAPLPMPFLPEVLELGQERLRRLHAACGLPLGLENLALAFCEEDVREHGRFLRELVSVVDGFVLLDLHNVFCQAHNFGIPAERLIASYPLELVHELHLSGGSWSEASGATVRRDTHDGAVPEDLFPLLKFALRECPNVEAVIFERLGCTLPGEAAHREFQGDFHRIAELLHE